MKKYLGLIFVALFCFSASASVTVNVNGTSYTIPQTGEKGWGTNVTNWIEAVSSNALWPTGGTFALGADVDFGASFGLVSPYYKSKTSNIAGSGVLRLANGDAVGWRNLGNSGDFVLKPDADGILQYNSIDLVNLSATQTLTNKTLTSPSISGPTITGVAKIADGTAGAPSLTFANETTDGIYRAGTTHWGLAVGGVEGVDLEESTGGYANIGMGGAASTSDLFPLYVNRSIAGTLQAQFNNPDATAGSGVKVQVQSDGGSNLLELSSFTAATVSPDAYSGGRGVMRATGSLTGISLVADSSASSDVKVYAGGNGSGNKIATFNSSGLSMTGNLAVSGSSSGMITIQPQSAAGTYNFNLPTTAGNAGQVLTSQGGGSTAMTWSSALVNPLTTTGDIIYSSDNSGTASRLAAGTSGKYLSTQGTSAGPQWLSFTSPSRTVLTSTGTQTGTVFVVSGVTTAPTNGAVYTNNGHSFTVIQTNSGKTNIIASGTGAAASGTLTRSSGTGDASITFSQSGSLASYTPPSTAKALWVRAVGGGGGGGGSATGTSASGAGGGGGGGGYVEKLITSFDSTIYYQVGSGGSGGSAGNNGGTTGIQTLFVDSQNYLDGLGGGGGSGSPVSGSAGVLASGGGGGSASGGDINVQGGVGVAGITLSASQPLAGTGGATPLGATCAAPGGTTLGGFSGNVYGGGGSGGTSQSNGGTAAGGAGAAGVILIQPIFNGN